jgi:hypothetical protein
MEDNLKKKMEDDLKKTEDDLNKFKIEDNLKHNEKININWF